MKKLKFFVNSMERQAYYFILRGLQVVLVNLLLLCFYIHKTANDAFSSGYFAFLCGRESMIYLIFSVLLVIGGGLFIDYALKKEQEKE